MELVYFFKILIRRKWIIIGAAFLAALVALLVTILKKDQYKSQAQISTGYTLSQEIKMSDNIFDQGQIDVKFDNVIENFTSSKVLILLSYKLILRDLSSDNPFTIVDSVKIAKNKKLIGLNLEDAKRMFMNKYDSMLVLRADIPEEKQLLELLNLYHYDIESIKKELEVSRYGKTDYIDIIYLSDKATLSEYVVNSLVKEFQRYYDVTMRERSIESMLSLDSIVNKRKVELDQRINTKGKFLKDSFSSKLDPSIINANKMSQASMYESGLADEMARLQSLNYQMEQINQQLQKFSDVTVSESAPAPSTSNKLYSELRKQYNELYQEYVKTGSSDQAIKVRLDDLQRSMKAAASTNNSSASNIGGVSNGASQQISLKQTKIDIEAALRSSNSKIEFYRAKLGQTSAIVVGSSGKSSGRLEQLDKEIELATVEYSNAKQRMTDVSNINNTGTSSFKQTMYGQAPIEPEPSKALLAVLLSGTSGMLMASFVFILIAYFDQTIKTPMQFQRLTGLHLIGSINQINLEGTTLKEQITQIDASDARRNNAFRELFRKLRYEVENSGKRVIMFTSTEPQQGKTTLLQSLALSLSLSNRKVLLIDTNFCNNDLTINNKAKPTLERFTTEGGKFDIKNIDKLVSKTRVENVDIIGCRGGDYTPSEILPKHHVLNYLQDLLEVYDFILFEGAPLNGFTDARELAKYAEGIVGIFAASSVIKASDKESIKFFKSVKDKFIGAVLNKVEVSELNFKS
jgi:Mrp family chromosome partitioning ATPase/capsular polysaccharide biosynthesis protein